MNINAMFPPEKSAVPNWKSFFRSSNDERKNIIQLMFFPCETKKENVIMWMYISVVIAVCMTCTIFIGTIIKHNLITSPIYIQILLWVWYIDVCVSYMISRSTHILQNKLSLRIDTQRKKEMVVIKNAINKLGMSLANELKLKSGRSDVPMDPISMTAAAIDVAKQDDEMVQEYKSNPLRAALDGVLPPVDLPNINPDTESY